MEYFLKSYKSAASKQHFPLSKSLFWGHFEEPKGDFFVNQAVIMGFEDRKYVPPFIMVFEPIHMARVQATKVLHAQTNEDDLLQLYRHWEKYCDE